MKSQKTPLRLRLEHDLRTSGKISIDDYRGLIKKQNLCSLVAVIRRDYQDMGIDIYPIKLGNFTIGYSTTKPSEVKNTVVTPAKLSVVVKKPYMSALEARNRKISEVLSTQVDAKGFIKKSAFDCLRNHSGLDNKLIQQGFIRHYTSCHKWLGWKKVV